MTAPAPDKTPGFCRDCLAEQKGEARRCVSCGSPRLVRHRRTLRTDACTYRLRRLLCLGGETRQSGACRQAGDHRRRQTRRGFDRLLHRPHPRRAFGHADVQGAGGLPAGDRHPPRHGEICPRRARGAHDDAGADAAGAAAFDRRGLPGARRYRAAASRSPGPYAGQIRSSHRKGDRHHRFGRAFPIASSSPRSPPTCRSRAAFRSSAASRGGGVPEQRGRSRTIWGVGKAFAATLERDGIRTIGQLQTDGGNRPDAPLWQHGPAALPAVARHGRARSANQR